MLGIIADLLAGVITILFPVFASYKALKASDPAQLAPWCIYWVILSLFLLAESWTVFILGWLPFYSWIRLLVLSYLVLPQTQGAKILYFNYVCPFIESHEHDIEVFISNSHERAMTIGLAYVNQLIDLIREKVLGLPAQRPPTPPPPQSYSSAAAAYSANLLSRFTIPSARAAPAATSDLYSLLSSAISAAAPKSSSSRDFPDQPDFSSAGEKLSFLAAQREKLTQLLSAVDQEQSSLSTERSIEADIDSRLSALDPTASLSRKRNKSEHSFENIDREDLSEGGEAAGSPSGKRYASNPTDGRNRRSVSGGWVPSSWWGSNEDKSEHEGDREHEEDERRGHSSGFDIGR